MISGSRTALMMLATFASICLLLGLAWMLLVSGSSGPLGPLMLLNVSIIPGLYVEHTVGRLMAPGSESWYHPALAIISASLFWTMCLWLIVFAYRGMGRSRARASRSSA
jgi:hypothetical protein